MATYNVTYQVYFNVKGNPNPVYSSQNSTAVIANDENDAKTKAAAIATYNILTPYNTLSTGVKIISVKEFNMCAVQGSGNLGGAFFGGH